MVGAMQTFRWPRLTATAAPALVATGRVMPRFCVRQGVTESAAERVRGRGLLARAEAALCWQLPR